MGERWWNPDGDLARIRDPEGSATSFLRQWGKFSPFVLIFVIMYFLIVRPQQKRVKQHQDGRAARTDGHVWRPSETGGDYFDIGKSVGLIAGLLTFIAAYVYCIATYGFLFGLGLGWLPSGILAALVGWMTVVLWGPVLLIIAVVAFFALSSHR